jgi:hypothetical protein
MYQMLKSKPEKLSSLVAFLGSRAELPTSEDIVARLTEKCRDLIVVYGQQWKQEGLLVSGGNCLRKSKTLRQVWGSHSDAFGRLEIRYHWGFSDIPDPTSTKLSLSPGPRKVSFFGPFL